MLCCWNSDNIVLGCTEKVLLYNVLKDLGPKHQLLWLCFTRQQTKAKNPDYFGRRAKAGFGEKLKKAIQYVPFKELGDHKQHSSTSTMTTPDSLWEVEWTL